MSEKEREGEGKQTCGRKCRGGGFTGPSGIAAMKREKSGSVCVPLEMLALHTTSREEISGWALFTRLGVVGRRRQQQAMYMQ